MEGAHIPRCVIVDDHAGFLRLARAALEREGVEVVGVAATSAQAIARTRELRPDVVLIDIFLEHGCGFALAERIAGRVTGPAAGGTSVILMSTYAETDLAELIETSPAIAFLTKRDLTGGAVRQILDRTSR